MALELYYQSWKNHGKIMEFFNFCGNPAMGTGMSFIIIMQICEASIR